MLVTCRLFLTAFRVPSSFMNLSTRVFRGQNIQRLSKKTLSSISYPPLYLSTRSSHFGNPPPWQQSRYASQMPEANGNVRKDQAEAADDPHQFQSGATTHRQEDQWKHREPYRIHDDDEDFTVKWKGSCHCGKIQYQLSRAKPLASKYCHCTTCQRLHGSPFQWAAIFHKSDINFTRGHHDLGWYDPTAKSQTHHLPCKVSCAFCRTPIMDEGRNMILLFPTLIEGIAGDKAQDAFKPTCHMFYPQRVVDFKGDGIVKFKGLDNKSDLLDDDGNVLVEHHEGMDESEMDDKKRKALDDGDYPATKKFEKSMDHERGKEKQKGKK